MSVGSAAGAGGPVLDDRVLSVYGQEILQSVADVEDLIVFSAEGLPIWQLRAAAAPGSTGLQPAAQTLDLEKPAKRSVGQGQFAFDFPLQQSDTEELVLRILVVSLDPPSLQFVADAVRPALECLSRQIRLDTSLTSRIAIRPEGQAGLGLLARLNELTPSGRFDHDVQQMLEVAREELGCSCVAAWLPEQDLLARACRDQHVDFIDELCRKLLVVQKSKRRPVAVKLERGNGEASECVCAPLVTKHRAIEGVVLLVAERRERGHSAAVRTLSARIAALEPVSHTGASLVDRADLINRVDATLAGHALSGHALIYIDIDKMHTINDAFGYTVGDKALERCGQLLLDSAGANDTVAHLNGDRYALFMPGATLDTAMAKADQILRFLGQETVEDESKAISLSASAGVSSSESVSKGGEELLILAEVASRGAQDRGGNQCASYQDVDSSIIQRRSDVDKVGFLQTALLENQFELHAQRIEAINTAPSQKYELLARLSDVEVDNGSAQQFLLAAERYQMMAALDRWVINAALAELAGAHNTLEVSLSSFCINVSAQSLQDDGFADHVEARIADAGIPPDILCFEITETSLVRYIDRAQRFVKRMQRLGCQVALDDFGTGYSSFAYLKTLPVNILKIDGSFVRDLLECPLSATIVSSAVAIADNIGATTVAEHVENDLVRSRLRDLGVHFVQGFAIHRPEPLQAVLESFDNPLARSDDLCDSLDLRSDTLGLALRSINS